ncbi:MAG: (2Fe-2S)-binding protein [Deltaproteobacteria bacterium]|nr:(2Fe-2S)-binding protein [Deltaproteobacteria bacterium]
MAGRPRELASAPAGAPVTIDFEGRALSAKEGEPIAVTLLAHGIDIASRSVKYHRPRGAFCMSGSCGQCWMRMADVPNRPACMTPATDGLTVERQNAFPSADNDVMRAADFVFSSGLDHHRLGTTHLTAMNEVIGSTARQLAGLGVISERAPSGSPSIAAHTLEVLVIGAGPAGLEASLVLQRARRNWLLVDARATLGGHLATGLFDDDEALMELLRVSKEELPLERRWGRSIAAAIYREVDDAMTVLVRRDRGRPSERLVILRPKAIVLATGGYEVTPLFENDDLPGHYGARALAKLVLRHGVLPGARVAIVDPGTGRREGEWLHRKLRAMGIDSTRLVEVDAPAEPHVRGFRRVVAAKGRDRIKSLVHSGPDGLRETLRADVVASAHPVSPAYELATQAGCSVMHRRELGGFVVLTDASSGRTNVAGVYAAGDLAGSLTPEDARTQGAIAGADAAEAIG